MVSITGGDKMKAALKRILAEAGKASLVEVGFLEGSTEPDGTSIPMIAAIQEFGAPRAGIPPRPFFRNAIAKNSGQWPAALAALLKATDYDAGKALGGMGLVIASEIQQSIIEMDDPALSEVTVMLRGMRKQKRYKDLPFGERIAIAVERVKAGKTNYGASTKPLVDSGNLLKSVDYKLKD